MTVRYRSIELCSQVIGFAVTRQCYQAVREHQSCCSVDSSRVHRNVDNDQSPQFSTSEHLKSVSVVSVLKHKYLEIDFQAIISKTECLVAL